MPVIHSQLEQVSRMQQQVEQLLIMPNGKHHILDVKLVIIYLVVQIHVHNVQLEIIVLEVTFYLPQQIQEYMLVLRVNQAYQGLL